MTNRQLRRKLILAILCDCNLSPRCFQLTWNHPEWDEWWNELPDGIQELWGKLPLPSKLVAFHCAYFAHKLLPDPD